MVQIVSRCTQFKHGLRWQTIRERLQGLNTIQTVCAMTEWKVTKKCSENTNKVSKTINVLLTFLNVWSIVMAISLWELYILRKWKRTLLLSITSSKIQPTSNNIAILPRETLMFRIRSNLVSTTTTRNKSIVPWRTMHTGRILSRALCCYTRVGLITM